MHRPSEGSPLMQLSHRMRTHQCCNCRIACGSTSAAETLFPVLRRIPCATTHVETHMKIRDRLRAAAKDFTKRRIVCTVILAVAAALLLAPDIASHAYHSAIAAHVPQS